MRYLFIVALSIFPILSFAQQPKARAGVTQQGPPPDDATIRVKKAPLKHKENFFDGGYKVGSVMPDLTLYTVDGMAVNFKEILRETHKPLLLITGSYSCPSFRKSIRVINSIMKFYGKHLNIYVIYSVEAHPVSGKQPYIYTIDPKEMTGNYRMAQANTYKERKDAVNYLKEHEDLLAPVLVDGPKNEWWAGAGCAANNAYLVDTKSIIVAKNEWFSRIKQAGNMWCNIDKLLGTNTGHCDSTNYVKSQQ